MDNDVKVDGGCEELQLWMGIRLVFNLLLIMCDSFVRGISLLVIITSSAVFGAYIREMFILKEMN